MAKKVTFPNGCWFCNMVPETKEEEPLSFDCEFDTAVHLSCIREKLKHPDSPEAVEAQIMSYLLPEMHDEKPTTD